jgi:hypothetical protein
MNVDQLAHDLIAENKALKAIVKKHRSSSGNKGYDMLCFIIAYPHIVGTIKNKNLKDGGESSPNIQLERICLDINKEDISVKIYEILDNFDNVYEKVLLMITIAQVAVFKQDHRDKLVSIMEKYDEFKLILEIYACLN